MLYLGGEGDQTKPSRASGEMGLLGVRAPPAANHHGVP